LPYLAGLSKYGYYITVISAEKKENYAKRKGLIETTIQQHNLTWAPVFYTKKPPVVSTLWDLYKIRQKALQLHKINKFRIVHCRSYITALAGLYLKKKTGAGFIFDMRGFWADERVEGGLWNLHNALYKQVYEYFKRKEKEFLQQAGYTVSLTYGAKEEILRRPGLENIPIQVIPCCADTALFTPLLKTPEIKITDSQVLQPGSRLRASFVVSYLGSLGTWYLLDEMLQFFKRLLIQKPQAVFLFITPDDPQLILQKAALYSVPPDKLIIRKAERNEVPGLLAASQLSIFFIKPSYSKKASSPTKMGEILSMGIPVICNAGVGDTDYLFSAYTPGILVKELNDENYDKAVARIDEVLQVPSQNLRNIALNYFALEKGVEAYHQIYQKLLH
jgi:glycosyltransferase involved in cell wall biosynthesis